MGFKIFVCVVMVLHDKICRCLPSFEKDHTFNGKLCTPIWHDFGEISRVTYCAVMCDRQADCHGFFHGASLKSCLGINYDLTSTSGCASRVEYNFYRRSACGVVPQYANAVVQMTSGLPRQFTCSPKYRKTVPNITCTFNPVIQVGSWNPPTAICTELYGSTCASDDECAEIGGACVNNQCSCEPSKAYDTTQMTCVNRFKLIPGNGGDGVVTGQLYMLHDGVWGNVCHASWTWTASGAICRDINPAFTYGGTYHTKDVYGRGLDDSASYELKELDCGTTGDATSIGNCTYTEIKTNCDHNKDVGLTCYESDVTGNIRLNPDYTKDGFDSEHRLEIFHNGTWGTVCKHDWGSSSSTVACRSIDPLKPKTDRDCTDSCAGGPAGPYVINGVKCTGDETNIFYCLNAGWTVVHSCLDDEVGLLCKAN